MKGTKNKKKEYCTNLRLSKGLAKIVKANADMNERSINSEIVHALNERYVKFTQQYELLP